ncbi:MAG: LptF/LptG family permease, partial [Verrucomicrobiae bacterium]|nr:LptF/LptG family permease [Verrucomicrobiae bacterium]
GWIKLSVEPAARHKLERMLPDMLYNLASKNPLALFTDRQVMKEIPGYLIFAEREEDHLKHFQMVVLDKTSRPQVFVIAKRVNVGLDPEAETPTMLMDLRDAYFELTSPDGEFSEMQPYAARSAPMPVGLDTLRDAQRKMKPETLQTPEILREIRNPEHKKDVVSSLKTEVSMRFAFSFACVTLGLIGVPLGITAQRRETSVGFALSLLVGIAYFLLMTIVEMMRENNSIRPYYLAWLPNLLFIGLGVYLFRRLAKK